MNRDLPSKKDAIADKENIEQPRTMNMQEFEAEMRKLVLGDGEKDQDNGKSNSSMIQDERLYRVDKLMLKKLIDEQVTQILKEIVWDFRAYQSLSINYAKKIDKLFDFYNLYKSEIVLITW